MKDSILKSSKLKLRSPWVAGQIAIWSFVLIGSFFTSLFIHYSSVQISSTLPTVTFLINGGGMLCGGFVAGRMAGFRGWLFGGLQGIIYASLLLLISFLAFDTGMRINPILFSTFSFGISAIGGIIGMNTNKK